MYAIFQFLTLPQTAAESQTQANTDVVRLREFSPKGKVLSDGNNSNIKKNLNITLKQLQGASILLILAPPVVKSSMSSTASCHTDLDLLVYLCPC